MPATAPDLSYSPPITITAAGTYTGNYRSLDSEVACITVTTDELVIIEDCVLSGAGNLITAVAGQANLIIRRNRGYATEPSADNVRQGRFLEVNDANNVVIEHNYAEYTTGIDVYRWDGPGVLTVRYNWFKNLDGRFRNGGGQYCNFVGLNTARLDGGLIAWNAVTNTPDDSRVEDVVNLFNSGGSAGDPLLVEHNLVYNACPFPANSEDYTGSGITVDGDDDTTSDNASSWNTARYNVLLGTRAGLNIASGHDNHYISNTLISAGLLPDGVTHYECGYAGEAIFNPYGQGSDIFHDNTITGTTIGFVAWGGNEPYPNRRDDNPDNHAGITGTIHLENAPVTLAMEEAAYETWLAEAEGLGYTVGAPDMELVGAGEDPVDTNIPPTVSLACSPSGSVAVGGVLTLTATAADENGVVSQVAFYNGSTLIGLAADAPWTFDYIPTTVGTLLLHAEADDDDAARVASNVVSITVTAASSAVARRIRLRTDTAAHWTAANPILKRGETGFESDTRKRKTGTSTTSRWNSLSYDEQGTPFDDSDLAHLSGNEFISGFWTHYNSVVLRSSSASDDTTLLTRFGMEAASTVVTSNYGAAGMMISGPGAPVSVLRTADGEMTLGGAHVKVIQPPTDPDDVARLEDLQLFIPIAENEAGTTHPAFTDQYTLNLFLLAQIGLGGGATVPEQVTGLTAGTPTPTTMPLSWTAPATGGSSIITYLVEYRLAGAGSYTTFVHAASPATSLTVTGLANATSYDFRVSAVNGVGAGTASSVVTAATTAASPDQVTGLTAGTPAPTSLPFTWSIPYNGGGAITDYLVEYRVSGAGSYTTFSHSPSTTAAITISGLTASTTYDVRVSAINSAGTGLASAVTTATTAVPAPPAAPTNLAVDADHGASFTPVVGTVGSEYEYEVS